MIPEQIWKPFVIVLTLLVLFLVVRAYFYPASFGQYGHYRGAALGELASKPIHFAGKKACVDCHDAKVKEINHSKHADISCENCHGPSEAHVEDPTVSAPVTTLTNIRCLKCHGMNEFRRKSFPQVIEAEHNPDVDCLSCHNPHHPENP